MLQSQLIVHNSHFQKQFTWKLVTTVKTASYHSVFTTGKTGEGESAILTRLGAAQIHEGGVAD